MKPGGRESAKWTKVNKAIAWAIRNDGSDWVGARGLKIEIFWNDLQSAPTH
jgi:hypothetical protein